MIGQAHWAGRWTLASLYQHLDTQGEFVTGQCMSTLKVLANGRYRLHEFWRWMSGDYSSVRSVIEEVER